jgi:hypothetical protein
LPSHKTRSACSARTFLALHQPSLLNIRIARDSTVTGDRRSSRPSLSLTSPPYRDKSYRQPDWFRLVPNKPGMPASELHDRLRNQDFMIQSPKSVTA